MNGCWSKLLNIKSYQCFCNFFVRLASENASFMSMYGAADMDATGGKPKLTRQTAIMADGDSTCSGKSVTFKEPAGVGSTRRFVAATTELGQCPLHAQARGAPPKGQK